MNRRDFLQRIPRWTAPVVTIVVLPAHAMLSELESTPGPCIFNRFKEGPRLGEIEEFIQVGKFETEDECRRVCEHVEIGVFDSQNCITANPTRDSD